MTLINLVEQCDSKLTSAQKSYLSTLGVVDNPVKGLLTLEEYLIEHNPQPGDSFVCLVPVGICFSDSKYNRSDRIHFGNIIKHLKRMMGFSYKAAGILSGFLRLNREQIRDLQYGRASSQYTVVVTKGNHRVTKRYAVSNDPRSYVPMEITIHKTEDYNEMVRIESLDHTLDAAYRTSQNQEDKFKSSYYAKETDAINLYNYLDQFSIGVAGTNPNAKFGTTSHNYLKSAQRISEASCSKYLKIFTEKNCENLVGGNATFAATVFLSTFKKAIDTVDTLNSCNSFEGFIQYIYHDRNNYTNGFLPDMTQSKLTEGNAKYKGCEVNVARLISLYNEYCEKVLKATLNGNNDNAIGYSSDAFINYMKSADPDIRARFVQVSKDRVS
tara:strand:+ start:127 stop:1278 length:1152 start_codon:yes stop_codon:yes gene_type:complete